MPTDRSTADSLRVLGLDMPKLSGKSQAEVDAKLTEWKEGTLKKAWHLAAQKHHPDRNVGDPTAADRFKEAQESYEHLLTLQTRLKPPKEARPLNPSGCPAGHTRIPSTAKYCHECGYSYGTDPVVELLRKAGITERNIVILCTNGEMARLQKLRPGSAELDTQVRLLQQRQRLGLIGQHAGWTPP